MESRGKVIVFEVEVMDFIYMRWVSWTHSGTPADLGELNKSKFARVCFHPSSGRDKACRCQ